MSSDTNKPLHSTSEQVFQYTYENHLITARIWYSSQNVPISTIVFLGTVQIEKHPEWIAQMSPPGTAIIQGAPHWHAKDDGSDIPEFMYRFTKEAFSTILKKDISKALHIIADSQASPTLITWLTVNNSHLNAKRLTLLQPLGLNPQAFEGNTAERIRKFKKRVMQNFRYQLKSLATDPKLRYNHRLILKTVGYRSPKAYAQYDSGLAHNSIPNLKSLTDTTIDITIICGAQDMIFPATEIKQSLQQAQLPIPIITIPGVPHSPLATKNGHKLLSKAMQVSI